MKKLVAALLLLTPAVALGQAKVVQEPDKVIYRHHTEIDMTGGELWDSRDRPEGSYKVIPAARKFASLIQLRDNFNSELQASVDALR